MSSKNRASILPVCIKNEKVMPSRNKLPMYFQISTIIMLLAVAIVTGLTTF